MKCTLRWILLTFTIFNLHFLQGQGLDSLSLKIGQMILIGLPSTKIDPKILEGVRSGKVGSLIIFEKNIPPKNSYHELKKITWTYQRAASIPLFIAIDQEGGRINRLKQKYGFPRSVSAAKLGKYPLDSVRFYGETTAATLAGLGINVNFAPVVDVASNPTNPIIAKEERAYSSQADSVALFAREVINEHRKLGIVTVLKHFPGHGSSKDDTHLGLADVTNTWHESELVPYTSLMESGDVDAIMTAHIVNKKLDETGNPGTLSKEITNDLLRDSLGYEGVVFSDDLQMHAITKHFKLEESILLAINAGVDILTFSNNIQGSEESTVNKVHQIIRKLVDDGTISKERIDQSFTRIMLLKRKLSNSQAEYYRQELMKANEQIRQQKQQAEMAFKAASDAFERTKKEVEKMKKEEAEQGQPKSKKKKKKNK